jgi:tetratricopeptide (TPR) repeat protein
MYIGIFGSWFPLTGTGVEAQEPANDDNAEIEYENAVNFKRSKYFNKAGKAFSVSAKCFSDQGNHFQAGKAFEEAYKAFKMVQDQDNSICSLKSAIEEYKQNATSHSIAARHCITLSKSFAETKNWPEAISILTQGIQLLSDLQDDRAYALKGDLGDLYAEQKDLDRASNLFKEILPFVLNFSREKYIFRDLLCLALLKRWDDMDRCREMYVGSYPAFKDSPSEEFIKSIYNARSDMDSVAALIKESRPGFIPSWAIKEL